VAPFAGNAEPVRFRLGEVPGGQNIRGYSTGLVRELGVELTHYE
jgi:hypothetical protein